MKISDEYVQKFLSNWKANRSKLKMEVPDTSPINETLGNTRKSCRLIAMAVGMDPECFMFGKITGLFTYPSENGECRLFQFMYHVHKPHQRPHDANHMSSHTELVKTNYGGITALVPADTTFGNTAYWMRTPTESLKDEPEAYALRRLQEAIKKHSVENGLCRKLRRMDAKREAHLATEEECRKAVFGQMERLPTGEGT